MNEIIIKHELRPCIVDRKKALFHCWGYSSDVCAPSILKGGHNGGTVSRVYGIVEFEDGTVRKILPEKIRFTDYRLDEYIFAEDNENG